MEQNNSDSSSDRDRDMMRRAAFEGFGDTPEKHDDKAEKKKKKKKSVAEKGEDTVDKRDTDDKKDQKEKLEKLPLTELTGEETKRVVEEIIENTEPELAAELEVTEPDSPEEFAVLSDAQFIEALKELAGSEDELDPSDIEEAYEDTVRNLQLESFDEVLSEEEDEDDPAVAGSTAGTASTPPTPPPVVLSSSGGSSGSSGLPPRPPIPPVPTPPAGGVPPLSPLTSPNVVPHSPNIVANSVEQVTERSRRGADLLVGGVIGYLIGRRRGRIKTEEKLMPVQEKLEKQVRNLQTNIAEKEVKIRELAVAKAEREPQVVRSQVMEKIESLDQPSTAPEIIERKTVVIKNPEKVGRAVIAPFRLEQEKSTPEKTDKSAEMMTMSEILTVAAKIEVDGISVKEMYESNKLDAIGLRRVVKEYLGGGRYERVLSENLKGEEYARERALEQDTPRQQASGSAYGSGAFAAPAPAAMDSNDRQIASHLPATDQQPNILREIDDNKTSGRKSKTAVALGIAIVIVIIFLLT